MNEVEKREAPDVAGGQVDAYGNPLPVAYPIYPVPIEKPTNALIVPESPLS